MTGKISAIIPSIGAFILLCVCIVSCSKPQDDRVSKLQTQIDSLSTENSILLEQQNASSQILGIITESLDSIAEQEHFIRVSGTGVEGKRLTVAEQRQRLKDFAELLERQRNRIAQLEDSLASRGKSFEKLSVLVSYLNQQLEERNRQIVTLQKQIASGKIKIQDLSKKIEELTDFSDSLSAVNTVLADVVTVQSDIINEGYFIIGSKKELKAAGILTGGGLSRKKINASSFATAGFTKVDIKSFTELTIKSAKIEILTAMPKGSYQIVREGGQCRLLITDPTSFWKVSNYLIIQTL